MSDTASPSVLSPLPVAHEERPLPPRLRLWPGVIIVALMWVAFLVLKSVELPMMVQFQVAFFAPMVATAAVALWWLFASRIPWRDRLLGLIVYVAAGVGATLLNHPSFGPMAMIFYALPIATTAWVVWLVLTPFLQWPARRAGLVVVLLLAWGGCTLLRFDGTDGSFVAEWNWRWHATKEDQYLAERAARKPVSVKPAALVATEVLTLQPGDWPAFRGPQRDGRLTGVRVPTDWKEHPPKQLWRHGVGPGWSSFTVVGNRAYTQEQRGADEVVVCYDASTGEELWAHQDAVRFTESMAGPGPRATPTFDGGRLYTLGATGLLNCLDPVTGRVLWSHNVATDSGAKVPIWGFASSPLVVQGIVTVFAGGPEGKVDGKGDGKTKSVLGYHADSGDLAWAAGKGELSYCSPQLARLCGVDQLLILTDEGLTAFEPTHGTVLWDYSWKVPEGMARIVQPAVLGDTDILIGTSFDMGTRRIHVSRAGDKWTTQDLWTTQKIKPYYNDFVVHQGYLYGFDGAFFTCVSLEEGKARWRERGYGNGQVLLLADEGLLLVLSEKGDVVLVEANPESRKELARFPAIQGKTWNHPVIAHGKLFVRNGEEAACFQLTETDAIKVARD